MTSKEHASVGLGGSRFFLSWGLQINVHTCQVFRIFPETPEFSWFCAIVRLKQKSPENTPVFCLIFFPVWPQCAGGIPENLTTIIVISEVLKKQLAMRRR